MMSVLIVLGLCSGVVMGSAATQDPEVMALFIAAKDNDEDAVRTLLSGKSA